MAGIPSVQPVANFGVGSVHLIAQTEVQSQMRGEAPFDLRIAAGDPLPKAAVELAAALKELHGLAQQEAGEGVAGREWCEHEESVGGDTEECVDLLPVEFSA